MPVTINPTDTVGYDPETWVKLLDTPQRDYLAVAYSSIDVQISNITTGTTRDFLSEGKTDIEVDIEYVSDTDLEDWTTQTLLDNAEFSRYPDDSEFPKDWFEWTRISGSEIKRDGYSYRSAPASCVFKYSGTAGASGVMGIAQEVKIRDVLQTKGIYRLMFYYLASDNYTTIFPALRLNDEDGYSLGVVYLAEQSTTTSTGWRLYDGAVEFASIDDRIKSITLIILIRRLTSGAFTFRLDDVDFHYGFDLNTYPRRPPAFPSAIFSEVPTVFDRTADDRTGVQTVLGGGVAKHEGTIQFRAIPTEEMENLKAAWGFNRGHRLNVVNVWPHRADVMCPGLLEFFWRNDWECVPAYAGENLHNLDIEIKEK